MLMQLRMRSTKGALPLFLAFLALAVYGGVPGKASAHQPPSNKDSRIINTVPAASAIDAGRSLSAAMSRALAGPPGKRSHQRKGLAVIADFADARLEDWQGDGINNVAELSDQLHKMEEHWAWLSRGLEKFQWDILRVRLPVNLRADAYPSWADYRDAVATLAKQQINIGDYDANRDGVVDSMWIIASNNGMDYDYLTGGTSRNAGANIFVDGQSSLSIVSGATGNFNHEVGHTRGLPDLYGTYETLHYLTVMSESWPLPPQDFTAYERILLGWVKPIVVRRTRRRIHLSSPDERMKAVRVSTPRTFEYFLIEYRNRPDSGFGSNAPPYNGLAIYHVLETSNQGLDPPLVKLEAADGSIGPGAAPQLDDFLYPENPNMLRPLVLRSYFGHQDVFQIDNVQWDADGGLVFDVTVLPMEVTQSNLLINPSFEQGTGSVPDAWQPDAYDPSTATFTWKTNVAKEGRRSVSISASAPNDARWIQTVWDLDPAKTYQFCGWIRGRDVATGPEAGVGANVSVIGGFILSQSLSGSFNWTQVCVGFRPENTSTTLACRLGFYGSTVTGRAWCDRLTLEPLESAF